MRVSDLELKLDLLISMAAACGPRGQMYPRCCKRLVFFQVRVDDQVYLWKKPTTKGHIFFFFNFLFTQFVFT